MFLVHVLVLCTIVISCHGHPNQDRVFYNVDKAESLFEEFIKTYNKNYDENEYSKRFDIFVDNLKLINERNEKDSAVHGINSFTDMTWEEFSARYGLVGLADRNISYVEYKHFDAPESVDYRQKGVVNPIKNQGSCGSCWAFAAMAILESRYALNHNTLYSLSEQQLVDCDKGHGDNGCSGGLPTPALNYLSANGGAETDRDYPYTASDNTCRFDASKAVVTPQGSNVNRMSEESLKMKVADEGPVAIAINMYTLIQTYTRGVVDPGVCNGGRHAVAIVGYGSENGQDYWLVRNSWGSSWGESGYFKLIRGKEACGVNHEVSDVRV